MAVYTLRATRTGSAVGCGRYSGTDVPNLTLILTLTVTLTQTPLNHTNPNRNSMSTKRLYTTRLTTRPQHGHSFSTTLTHLRGSL